MTKDELISSVTVVLRSSKERTIDVAKSIILEQGVPEKYFYIVNEAPFSKALRASYEIGIDCNNRWTFCVDADVLLRKDCISNILSFSETLNDKYCEIQGGILDKFFGGSRAGGIHLYRTAHLPKAIKLIPREGSDIRPEFRTLTEMTKAGFPSKQIGYVVGIHDFEQYYCDIYRKTFVYAQKHQKHAIDLIGRWKELQVVDLDYKVALLGLIQGLISSEMALIDVRNKSYHFSYSEHQIIEKPPINTMQWSASKVENIIKNWVEFEDYSRIAPFWSNAHKRKLSGSSLPLLTISEIFKERGLLKSLALYTGYALRKTGNTLIGKNRIK